MLRRTNEIIEVTQRQFGRKLFLRSNSGWLFLWALLMATYRVKDWDKHYELAQSRPYKHLTWVKLPNKHDGKGFNRIRKHPQCCDLFTAWVLIVQVASKMETRGLLVDEDGPLSAEDLADKTGFPERIFDLAFKVLVEKKFKWLEVVADSRL